MKTKTSKLSLLSMSILSSLYGGNLAIENPQVVSGQVSFDGLQSNAATITQHSNKAIVDYDRFDVLAGGAVNFAQPSAQAAILNRIQSADPSMLNGTITGNGQIYFVNPAGVTFGPNSIIRADTFMAVAGQVANDDFLAGQLQFDLQGTVSNYGLIETLNDVALLGDRVINAGDIVSISGVSILSAGDEVILRQNGSTLAVQLTTVNAAPKDGVAIENSGTVAGDEVMFSAGDAYSLALSNSGTVRAAKSAKLYADGGAIEVSGQVSARSDAGAGRIEIGGTDLGGPSAPIAAEVLITETARIDASAQVEGEGGEIVIYSAGETRMYGAIDAQSIGDADAGHVEVSGSNVDLGTAPWDISIGRGGSLLIDPTNIVIDQPAATGYETQLRTGTDVTVMTASLPDLGEAGDITLNGAINNFGMTNVGHFSLEAEGSIFVNGLIDNGDGNITFDAQQDITLANQVGTGAPGSGALIQMTAQNGALIFNGGAVFLYGDANAQLVAQQLNNGTNSGGVNLGGTGYWQIVLPTWNTTDSSNEQIFGGLVSGNKAVFGSTGDAAAITQNEYHFTKTPVIGIQVNDDSKTYGDAIVSDTYQQYVVDPATFVDAGSSGGVFTQDTVGNTIIDLPANVVYTTAGSPTTANADTYTDLTLTGLESTNGYSYDVTSGTFTVLKRALQVTADDRDRIYGNELDLGTSLFTYIDTHEGPADTVLPNGEELTVVVLGSVNDVATDTTFDVDLYTDNVTVGALSGTGGFDPNNYEVTGVAGDLEVFQREITVTALEQEKIYGNVESFGGTVDSLNGLVFEVTDLSEAQLPNGEEIISTTMKYATGVDLGKSTITGVGTTSDIIEITGVTGNTGDATSKAFNVDNYDIHFENGDYKIVPREITVTALPQSKQYGEELVLLNGSLGGFEVLDDLTSGSVLPNGELIDTVALASAAGYDSSTTQGVGTYNDDLVISGLDTVSNGFNEANYAIDYVEGALTINPREVTLTALQQSKLYGDTMTLDDELFTIADQGVVDATDLPNGEMINTVTLQSVTGVAGSTTADAQIYIKEINITDQAGSAGFDAANYDFTYVDGNLLVSPRPITVTALEQQKIYGNVESFGGDLDSLDGSQFTVTDVSEPELPNGESITSTTMDYALGNDLAEDLGASSTAGVGTTEKVIRITGVTGNAGDASSKAFNVDNYNITFERGDYTIVPREITVTARQQNKEYGEILQLVNTEFDVEDDQTMGSALPNGEQIVSVVVASDGGYDSSTTQAAGTYEDDLVISALDTVSNGFDEANYTIKYIEGHFEIDPRQVTLTALPQSKLYGDTMTLDGELFTIADQGVMGDSDLPNQEMIDSVSLLSATGVASSTTADAQLYGDEIQITDQAGSAGFDAANYDFTYVDGDLLVNQRPITVTADHQVKTYGESVVLTESAEFTLLDEKLGALLPNGETIDSVNLLSAGDNGSSTSAAGSYSDDLSITALNTSNDFDLSNYDVTYVKGDFLVNRRSITISLLDQVKPYGEPYAFDSEAFTLYDPLSDTATLPNGEQVVGVNFQTPAMNPITAAPKVYESLLQGESAIGGNGFDSSNYSITFNPANLWVYYINDIEEPVFPGEAYLDEQEYVYSGSPFMELFNTVPPISENGFSSIVERPEWTSMTREQQAWVFSQVSQMQGGTQLSEQLVEYLIAGAQAQ